MGSEPRPTAGSGPAFAQIASSDTNPLAQRPESEDFTDLVSGTNGLTGAADGIVILTRSRGSADGELHLTGRDVVESTKALRWNADRGARHRLDGPVEGSTLATTRAQIHKV